MFYVIYYIQITFARAVFHFNFHLIFFLFYSCLPLDAKNSFHNFVFDFIICALTQEKREELSLFLTSMKERVSKLTYPHAPTLRENVVYNEWQFQALVTGNRTENQFHRSCKK